MTMCRQQKSITEVPQSTVENDGEGATWCWSIYGKIWSCSCLLVDGLLNQGRHLHVDNWYSSLMLEYYLKRNNTYALGTVQRNRCNFLDSFKAWSLTKGELAVIHKKDLLALHLKDKRSALSLNNTQICCNC